MPRTDDPQVLHRQAWDLIPWVVNGSAAPEERRLLEAHLIRCRDCREEYESQRRLRAVLSQEQTEEVPDPRPGLARLWARIDGTPERAQNQSAPTHQRPVGAHPLGLALAVIVEAAVIAVLSVMLWLRTASPAPAAYHTLTRASRPAPAASVRAVFAPDLQLAQLQRVLARAGLQIVSGPSEAGVYTLAPLPGSASADAEMCAARLRADPAVRFAEPIAAAR